ncbi:MAG TPA: elongation factor Ts [Parachlamydiales bacterium]|nr:MAG: translation elongation factor Ts [Chlamydiae bacterium GWA2_50_15]OGN57944.1 MAG: translation elongation factor Ts [Chlamydiae bacterium RIFCSPHIGHO2_02_FULL_49_29]OGN71124.1 MAG: translation elongation factor Ts [Chlamydiae bacterium RIFCSPLOWO2_02_FULL_49_12]HAZ15252.1 elongation factor Ts [Parachlamydiales bacterium]
MKVTPKLVQELRERTGVGMSKCKEALDLADGDLEKAIEILRKKGMAAAVKKEGREAKEGLIGVGESGRAVALVEVSAETDFAIQNEKFKRFLNDVALEAALCQEADLAAFLKKTYSKDASLTIDAFRALAVQSIGENIQIRRLILFTKNPEISLGVYSHMRGKIVSVVELSGGSGSEELARSIAMHIAAESPDYLRPEDVPSSLREKEEEIARSQIKNKPENIVLKIVDGKLKAFYDQVCLLNQKYIKDPTLTIEQLVAAEAKRAGKPLAIRRFIRWQV